MSATEKPGSPGSRRDMTGESPSDGPAAGIDMVAHVALERASFPPNRPALTFVQGRRHFVARLPALRQSLASAVMLGLRFVQARMISVWGLLVAAYFCPPHIFAAFAVFSAAAAFVSIPALMRLEAVFFRSGDGRELALAFRLALASGTAFLGLVAVVLIGLAATGWIAPAVALVFFLSLAARAVLRLLWAEATAEGDFQAIGNSNLMQALVQPCLMLLLIGLFGPKALALFLADALGHWAAAIHVMIRRRENIFALARPRLWSLRALAWGAKRWSDAPRILLPAALLSFAFTAAPLLALPYATDPLLAAQVALAMRLLDMPTQMFGMVSGPLLMNGLRHQSGQRRQVWVRWTTLALIAGTIGVYGPIALGTSHFDDLFDGSRWSGVGHVIAIMTMFYAGIALFNPLHDIAALSRTTGWQLAAHAIALFAIVATILWFGELSRDLLYAVGAISLARAASHVLFAWSGRAPPHRSGADVAGARAMAS